MDGQDNRVLTASSDLEDLGSLNLLASQLQGLLDILLLTVTASQHLAETPCVNITLTGQGKGMVASDRDGIDWGQAWDQCGCADGLLVRCAVLGSRELGVSQTKLVAV